MLLLIAETDESKAEKGPQEVLTLCERKLQLQKVTIGFKLESLTVIHVWLLLILHHSKQACTHLSLLNKQT